MARKVTKKPVSLINTPRPAVGSGNLISTRTLNTIERRYQVLQMRREGYTVKEIADALNCSPPSVRKDIEEVLNFTIKEVSESAAENRQLQIERLDGLMKAFYTLAVAGNMGAACMVLQIEARRSKLLALDIPETKTLELTGIREYVGIDVEDV